MNELNTNLHYVVVTGIICKEGKYLIAKRSPTEKAFAGLWCVPGGKLDQKDYLNKEKVTADHWCYLLEDLLTREIKEEVGLEVTNIKYLMDISYIRSDGYPTLILSLYCDWKSGDVVLDKSLVDYAWVDVKELSNYEIISGIREQIEMVDAAIKNNKFTKWCGKYDNPQTESKRDNVQL